MTAESRIAELEKQLRELTAQQTLTNQIVRAMREDEDLDELLQATADRLQETLGVSCCLIFRAERSIVCVSRSAAKWGKSVRGYFSTIGVSHLHSIFHQSLCRGQPVVASRMNSAQLPELRSLAIVPLMYRQSYIGEIGLHQYDEGREWSPPDLEFVERIADLCAIAIGQAEVTNQAERTRLTSHLEFPDREGNVAIVNDDKITRANLIPSIILDPNGTRRYGLGIVEDISKRQAALGDRTEAELLTDRTRLQYLLSSSPGAIYSCKPTDCYNPTFISENVAAICGYEAREFTTNRGFWERHIHPRDAPRVVAKINCPFDRDYQNQEYRFLHADGTYRWMYDQMRLVRDAEGNPLEIIGYWTDISDRKQAENSLQQAKDRLQAVLDAVPGFVSWIGSDLQYIGVNQHLAAAFNLSPDAFAGKEVGFLDNSPGFAEFIQQFFANPKNAAKQVIDTRINGETRHYLIAAQKYRQGEAAVSVGIDITYRIRAEEQIKSSLKEKEVLLKEIHHRVKNNLQVISSLLKLQSGYIKDNSALALFKDSYNRIRSMALIHENLYRTNDLGKIDVAEYVRTLTENLFGSYGVSSREITLKLEVDRIWLDVDTAIPCGLIINELVSNCFKYAFITVKNPEVGVQFYSIPNGRFILIVKDNGIGLPADFDFHRAESLGLQLVQNLTEQLGGTLKLDCRQGTWFEITFPSYSNSKEAIDESDKSEKDSRS